ncbi:MAG TPA: adenosylcobinamide-phosphate synthase CbiB [Chloroflexota bacterium]|nr:adenosylcobinamide-phosphate synthase CbiB [Chloroflexota bacterium]
MARTSPLATGALALGLDLAIGEPPAPLHPVVAMGKLIAAAERRALERGPLAQLAGGAALAVGGALAAAGAGGLAERELRALPLLPRLLVGALLLKSTFALRALLRAADEVALALRAGDLPTARAALRALVSRDPRALDAPLVAAAAVESLAENLSDSFVAPLLWYALLGLPGALAYRFVNTCDAMLGYRGRHEYLGKAAARLDDLANWLPARLTALLVAAAAPVAGGSARYAWQTARRDHRRTRSPNAGWPMSAMAGALRVRLEKRGEYVLGDGPPPGPEAIARAALCCRVAAGMFVGALALLALAWRRYAPAA